MALISPAPNFNVTPAHPGVHETSAAYSAGTGQWVVGFNSGGAAELFAGWSYSDDPTGATWHDNVITTGTQWGDPGPSPSNGSAFTGWRGDPTLAAVTDPQLSGGGNRILYAMVATTAASQNDDVVIAFSPDGGRTFVNASYVDDSGSGGGVDAPSLATNAEPPYHTFVGWPASGGAAGWIRQVEYASDGSFSAQPPVPVPLPPGLPMVTPNIAVAQYHTCSGALHEAVFVTWTTWTHGPCWFGQATDAVTWWFAMFDVVDSTWFGPWQMNSDPAWTNCVGDPRTIAQDPRPRIAVDSQGDYVWTAHTQGSPWGTRLSVDWGVIQCSGGAPSFTVNHFQPLFCIPKLDPQCDPDGRGRNDASGNPIVQDEWGPALGFVYGPGDVPRTVATWYSTRDDPGVGNSYAGMYMLYSEDRWSVISDPSAISVPSDPSETIPWKQEGDWWDYQTLGVNSVDGSLLGAWGGERQGSCRVFHQAAVRA